MDATPRVDAGLSHPLARPTLLFGLLMLAVAVHVGTVLPPIQGWSFAIWVTAGVIAFDFILVTVRKPGRLARWQVALLAGFSLAAAALLLASGEGAPSGRASAYAMGYLNLSVSLLLLRGHTIVATASAVTILSGLALGGVRAEVGPMAMAEYLGQPMVTLVGFWVIFLVSRSIARSRVRTTERQLSAVTETDAAQLVRADELRALTEIPDRVEPLLRRIVAGEPITGSFRAELIAADEEVRNLLRRDLPDHAGLLQAIADARARGVTVRLIGNEDPSAARLPEALAGRLIELLVQDGVTRATVRLLPRSRGGAVSLLLEGDEWARRYEFDSNGELLRQLA
ncbi:MAG: hypothetical protein QM695_10745 [Micropruina sp.]